MSTTEPCKTIFSRVENEGPSSEEVVAAVDVEETAFESGIRWEGGIF